MLQNYRYSSIRLVILEVIDTSIKTLHNISHKICLYTLNIQLLVIEDDYGIPLCAFKLRNHRGSMRHVLQLEILSIYLSLGPRAVNELLN